MSLTRFAAPTLAALTLAVGGCGGSAKSSNQQTSAQTAGKQTNVANQSGVPSGPLTRAQLIARGDAICYRLNVRRASTRIGKPQDYERLIPQLAAYELAAANEMGEITPPASMAHDWQQMVAGSHTIAEVTGHFHRYVDATNDKKALPFDIILGKGIDQLTKAAKRAGFKECGRFA